MIRTLATTYREAFSGLSRAVWLLSVTSLINRAGTMVMPFLLLFLVEKRGFTTAQAGQTLALYGLGAMVASYFGGKLCDRFSPLRVMKVSLVGMGLAFIVLGQIQGRLAISAMVVVLSLVGEVFRPANLAALAAASGPADRARSFALLRLAVNAGMSVGPTVGGFLAAVNYSWLFWADGVTSILAAGLLFFAFPDRLEAAPVVHPPAMVRAGSPFRDRPVMAILAMMFVLNVVTFQIVGTFPLSLRDLYGFSKGWIGITLAVNTVIIILFEMVLIHSLARRNPVKVAGFGAFLLCGGLALLPFGTRVGFAYVFVSVVIWTMGEMLTFPLLTTAVADRAPEATRGAYMGLLNFSIAASFVVAPLVGTWVYQQMGPRALWLGCGAVGLLSWTGFQAVAVRIGRGKTRDQGT